jgi:hypothetical protein
MPKGHKENCQCFICLAKTAKQIHTKERNLKISKAHKGKSKPWLHKPPKKYSVICKICNKNFITLSQNRTICDEINCQKQRGKNRIINFKTEQEECMKTINERKKKEFMEVGSVT